jgi:hypothetical protein
VTLSNVTATNLDISSVTEVQHINRFLSQPQQTISEIAEPVAGHRPIDWGLVIERAGCVKKVWMMQLTGFMVCSPSGDSVEAAAGMPLSP